MDIWCDRRGLPRGEVVPVRRCWELAKLWYAGRLDRDWRRASPTEMEHMFESVGLTAGFWKLT